MRLVYRRPSRACSHRRGRAQSRKIPTPTSFNALDWIDTVIRSRAARRSGGGRLACGETPGERYDDYFKHAAARPAGLPAGRYHFRSRHCAGAQDARAPAPARVAADTRTQRTARSNLRQGCQLRLRLSRPIRRQSEGHHRKAVLRLLWRSRQRHFLARHSVPRPLVCGQSDGGFQTRHLLSGKLDVFINLPLKVLQPSPQAARVILGALLNAVYEARGADAVDGCCSCSMRSPGSAIWAFSRPPAIPAANTASICA